MFSKILVIVIFFIPIFAFSESIGPPISSSESQVTQASQIEEVMREIGYLKIEINSLSSPKEYGIALGGNSENVISSDIVFDQSSDVIDTIIFQDFDKNNKSAVSGVDISKAVPITTQGQETYIGSYTSNNIIPIGRLSSNLFTASILNQRRFFDDYSLFFGGYLETDAQVWAGSPISQTNGQTAAANGENIRVTTATLYFISNIGHYVTTEFDFSTSDSGNFGLQDAFVMFGNLDTSPWFVTVGKYRLSVGTYGGGGPWTNGITTSMFRPSRVANLSLNYKGDTSNANVTVFNQGDHPSFSLAYFDAVSIADSYQAGFNVGYIYDMRGASGVFKNIDTKVGELNVDATITMQNILPGSLLFGLGWGTTTNKSDQFNGVSQTYAGAWTLQGAYSMDLWGKGTNFNISYGRSYNANDLSMPLSESVGNVVPISGLQEQYIASAQRAYLDNNVLFGPEYSRQNLYNGQSMNTVTLDISVYI